MFNGFEAFLLAFDGVKSFLEIFLEVLILMAYLSCEKTPSYLVQTLYLAKFFCANQFGLYLFNNMSRIYWYIILIFGMQPCIWKREDDAIFFG